MSAPTGRKWPACIETAWTYDRKKHEIRTFAAADCGFSYCSSRFKTEVGRYVILSVTFRLRLGSMSRLIRYPELARALGVEMNSRAPARAVRQAVLTLRRAKGMVLDDDDLDTWSAGSFTNPILDAQQSARRCRSTRLGSPCRMVASRPVPPG